MHEALNICVELRYRRMQRGRELRLHPLVLDSIESNSQRKTPVSDRLTSFVPRIATRVRRAPEACSCLLNNSLSLTRMRHGRTLHQPKWQSGYNVQHTGLRHGEVVRLDSAGTHRQIELHQLSLAAQ